MRQGIIRYGQFLFKYRSTVFPLVLIVVLVALRPRLPFANAHADAWLDGLGVLIVLAGLALRGLVIGLEYIKRGGRDGRVYADDLVTGGIFAASRNPLYVGNFLLALGVLVISGNPWAILAGSLLTLSAYHAIVTAEEAFLLDKFGEQYRDYCTSVNRWLPSPVRVCHAVAESHFNWSRVVLKDYGTVYLWLTAILVMLTYEHIAVPAYHQGWADQAPLGMVFVAYTVIYGVARTLKKKRLLTLNGWRTRASD